ncbi:hypothetical protein OS965_22630 [Streptomyces sp. H27-G5]|uniref:hypothetical protein n=1 Tax=Streptomyces sp. H27-G5 TaxID=2996698 RepID=UPI00226F119E|nr:hypothetical protein [Streptomyces sp. H27-G5]MCY0920944.1 hypothetical protein [Streptomyces sp. H27-G5]
MHVIQRKLPQEQLAGQIHSGRPLTREFTAAHPNAVVVAAGTGLCTRAQRLAGAVPPGVSRVGVDFPEVVDLR